MIGFMRFLRYLFCIFLFLQGVEATEFGHLTQTLDSAHSPFLYDLQIKALKGHSEDENVLLLLHGMGSDSRIAAILKSYDAIPDHLVSFNFPDAGRVNRSYDPKLTTFGSIQEFLPLLYILKTLVIDGKINSVSLYGFSAGGGALVNTIRVLNTETYDRELAQLGIDKEGKQRVLQAIQNGVILLDVSLKSMREIVAFRGSDDALDIVEARYRKNHFEPIDALKYWQGLVLNVIVFFENPDEILSNRDDALFVERIKAVNPHGSVEFLQGNNGGHISYHSALWKSYIKRESLASTTSR
jgi:hypothetical protein